MQTPSNGKNYLEELHEFLRFLRSLWGILAGVSALFPLSNAFVQVIPLIETNHMGGIGSGGLWFIPPPLVTTVTTLSALFIMIYTFEQRDTFKNPEKRPLIRRQALLSFAFGLLALLIYYGVITLLTVNFFGGVLGWGEGIKGGPVRDARWFITDTILLLCYATFFTLMTRAFELMAMREYFRGDSQRPPKGSTI
jgi:hypothetical protein